jgi:glycerate kinase
LTAREATEAIARGVERAGARAIRMPIADGGDGTMDALGGERRFATVAGPYGDPMRAEWRMLPGRRALVEIAQIGLARTRRRDPLRARSDGLGELLLAARAAGARRFLVALGGSASVDAGTGMARAMGASFVDSALRPWTCGGPPQDPAAVALPDLRLRIDVACDVRTTFFQAPRLYGPQKGASPAAVAELTRRFRRLARVVEGPRAIVARVPGSGAAGGIAWALAAMFGAALRPGAELVLDALGFDEALSRADFVITGEGTWDRTTREGKAPWEAVSRARAAGVGAVALCGAVAVRTRDAREIGNEGMRRAAALLEQAAFETASASGIMRNA